MSIDRVTINDNQYDFGSCTFLINGNPLIGVCGVKFSDKRERVKAYGAGRAHAPRGRTRGKYSAEASITLWKDSAEDLRQYLASQDPNGAGSFGNTEFQLSVQYFENELDLIDVEIYRCVIVGDDESNEENADPLKEDIALDVMAIVRNGITLFDNSDGSIAGVIGAIAGNLAGALGV